MAKSAAYKGERKFLRTRPSMELVKILEAGAAEQGMSMSDYLAIRLAQAEGRPDLAPTKIRPSTKRNAQAGLSHQSTQEELPLAQSA